MVQDDKIIHLIFVKSFVVAEKQKANKFCRPGPDCKSGVNKVC